MKILRITLRNIASLSGTHTVDFTREPLRSAGLFSISGPTGAGKSSLLDALCLALYDATPRLARVGRTAELQNGEQQKDPRSLLRRGAVEGFAEVAFLGVDNQAWTSRWSVRRSHKKTDGALQQIDIVLYRGHTAPDSPGPIEAGGKKTLVLKAIEEKIGLTFEQFTRAVLLAQNDFAAFLKADDKERAEILQALTGTERFEAISKAVYERSIKETKEVAALEMQLQGSAPLTGDARLAAELALTEAAQRLSAAEEGHQKSQCHAAWFRRRDELIREKCLAESCLEQAIQRLQSADPRRQELELTECVRREASPLRSALQQITENVHIAEGLWKQAVAAADRATAALQLAEGKRLEAERKKQAELADQELSSPQLEEARELDARFLPLQARFEKAEADLAIAASAHATAAETLQSVLLVREKRQEELRILESARPRLAAFLPFVSDTARWLDRLDAVISSMSRVKEARLAVHTAQQHKADATEKLTRQQMSGSELQAKVSSARDQLADSEDNEKRFNPDQLAAEKNRQECIQSLLRRLFDQLREFNSWSQQLRSVEAEFARLAEEQRADSSQLRHVQELLLPQLQNDFEVARNQLELIRAAVDDDAQRLRSALQTNQPCPVCGGLEHPYAEHAPALELSAVKAAQKHVDSLEKKRDDARAQAARLGGAIEQREPQIIVLNAERDRLHSALTSFSFDSSSHQAVAEVLALKHDRRVDAVETGLRVAAESLREIAEQERSYREAMKRVAVCRSTFTAVNEQLLVLQNSIRDLELQQGVLAEKAMAAERDLAKHEAELQESRLQLNDLWIRVPQGEPGFDADPVLFRRSFENSVNEAAALEERATRLATEIRHSDASIAPLQTNLESLQAAMATRQAELQTVTEERTHHLQRRAQLFHGSPVDKVVQARNSRLTDLTDALDEATRQQLEADRTAVVAAADVTSKSQSLASERTKLAAAQESFEAWLSSFSHSSRPLTVAELEFILLRDDLWVKNERLALAQLEKTVHEARGALTVRQITLAEHIAWPSTSEEESAVLAALELHESEVVQAREAADAARAIIFNDDERRRKNQELALRIDCQQKQAEPWQKLNELIGSADGAKFRMIAQRRTLDVLLRMANLQLNQLAVRYRLERIPESLNLIVVDRDMGDERRSIHSLSGGESFLVSLALALGLASLTSNRLRIETLFIDEGFGSLDPETLNMAMNALMHLESQGRKVGVISHVTEMTDAIPVQIKVVKGRGGASSIVVPGVTKGTTSGDEGAILQNAAERTVGKSPAAAAAEILQILKREQDRGKERVSAKSLREEVGCDPKTFRAAQSLLGARVLVDGRSLRLSSS